MGLILILIHKRRRPRHYRNNRIAPCGTILVKDFWPYEKVNEQSYLWKNVTCPMCKSFKISIIPNVINKFDNSVVK